MEECNLINIMNNYFINVLNDYFVHIKGIPLIALCIVNMKECVTYVTVKTVKCLMCFYNNTHTLTGAIGGSEDVALVVQTATVITSIKWLWILLPGLSGPDARTHTHAHTHFTSAGIYNNTVTKIKKRTALTY